MIFFTIILTAFFPTLAFPLTYVFGVLATLFIMSFANFAYNRKVAKAVKKYYTSNLVSYKVATGMAALMWFVLALIMLGVAFVPTTVVWSTNLFLFVLFMYCIYFESEVHIADNEVFKVKIKKS
jgi:hypothetical protein